VRPAVVILGFILGSAAAITFALVGTTIVFVVLRSDYPRLTAELAPLSISVALFALLTAAAAGGFYGEIKGSSWRRGAWVALVAMLVVVAAYFAWAGA
jgi:hypothetical protein